MTFLSILLLAAIQGAAELLPVSSSAHVIVGAKLMGLDPTSPEMTLLLVMLHTGTMFAVIFYFWKAWKKSFFSSKQAMIDAAKNIAIATAVTGVLGFGLKILIEKTILGNVPHAEIEDLFGNLGLVAAALFSVGILIILAGALSKRLRRYDELGSREAVWIGAVQGVCLPFRGFSRSGATISTGLLLGVARNKAEEFSFALAVVLTPPVIVREVLRLVKASHVQQVDLALFFPSLLGMVLSFISGLVALVWLSNWLERGRWQYFGYYCLAASAVVFYLHNKGY